MNLKQKAIFVFAMLAISIPASGNTLLDGIINLPGKIIKEIPFLNNSPCKPYAYEVKQVCLRGNADLTKEQLEYTKEFAPNIIQCIHGKQEVWVDVLSDSDGFLVLLYNSEKAKEAFASAANKKYEEALRHLRKHVCDNKERSGP